MIERIKSYNRYKDYYTFSCIEVKIATIITFILMFFIFGVLNFYEIFSVVQEDLKQIILAILGGEFTLLGMSLAGMAIITSLISPDFLHAIGKVDDNDTINRVLSHFEFSALNLGIQISYLLLVYFAFISTMEVLNKIPFIICSTLVCYHFFFNLFYIISLIGECLKINKIKTQSREIISLEKTIYDIANEFRIDFILAILLKEKNLNREQLLKELCSMIDKSNISDGEIIKEYFRNYY